MLDLSPSGTSSLSEQGRRSRGLRRNGVAISVMVLVQYTLGMVVNLFDDVPASEQHHGMFGSAFRAFVHSPVALALHAILGTLLILAAVTVSIRAWHARSRTAIVATVLGFLFVLGAWMSGAAFVDKGKDSSSFAMALLAGLAAACYVTTAVAAARLEHQRLESPAER